MAKLHGSWIWYELMTPDLAASAVFYGALLNWSFPPAKSEPNDYREIEVDGEFVGGLLRLSPEMAAGGCVPSWVGYVGVEDVDTSLQTIARLGGQCLKPAWDIPGVGRMAMVSDCCGAPFYVMTPSSDGSGTMPFSAAANPGRCGWNELMAGNAASAVGFYTQLFDWSLPEAMDMGPMGKYQFVAHEGVTTGAIMQKLTEIPAPFWAHYFWVPSITAANEAIDANGGQVINGPMEVPGGDWIVQGVDPQGAHFSLVGPQF